MGTHTDAVVPNWRQSRISIGPQPTLMVRQTGFSPTQWHDGSPMRWTSGQATLTLPWSEGMSIDHLEPEIWPDAGRDTHVIIAVNGKEQDFALTGADAACLQFSLKDIPFARDLSISLRSHSPGDSQQQSRGLPLKDIRLFRQPSRARKERAAFAGRFSGDRPWYEQNSLLFAELLTEPKRLRKLQITGGEPFLLPQTEEMLDYLIDTGVAANIVLNVSSNCTVLTDAHLEKLSKFRRIELCLSIEGVEEDQEYIRFPSKWTDISANVERFKTLANASVQVNPTVQVYNFMRMDRLIQWCDGRGLAFYPQRLVDPQHLSITVAPESARKQAARRIRAASERLVMPTNRQNAMALMHMLEAEYPQSNQTTVNDFMWFTNDLDRSRGQSFADLHAELLEHFRDAGLPWIDETVFLKKAKH